MEKMIKGFFRVPSNLMLGGPPGFRGGKSTSKAHGLINAIS
jgi:hypothetical protein